jgi:hypothetical protein
MFLSCEEQYRVPGSNEEYPVAQPLPPGPVSHWKYKILVKILCRNILLCNVGKFDVELISKDTKVQGWRYLTPGLTHKLEVSDPCTHPQAGGIWPLDSPTSWRYLTPVFTHKLEVRIWPLYSPTSWRYLSRMRSPRENMMPIPRNSPSVAYSWQPTSPYNHLKLILLVRTRTSQMYVPIRNNILFKDLSNLYIHVKGLSSEMKMHNSKRSSTLFLYADMYFKS